MLNIKHEHTELIKDLVKDRNGAPVRLLDIVDVGEFGNLVSDFQTVIDMVFVCLLDQVSTLFNVREWDQQNEKMYVLLPELKEEPQLKKAGKWFASRLDGDALVDMVKAFKEQIVNFIPDLNQRELVKNLVQAQDKLLTAQNQRNLQLINHRQEMAQQALNESLQKEKAKSPEQIMEEIQKALVP